MTRAKISELKARLSSYLAEVRKGGTVVVLDRKTPIARLIPYEETKEVQIVEPTRPSRELRGIKPIRLRTPVDPLQLLKESREQR